MGSLLRVVKVVRVECPWMHTGTYEYKRLASLADKFDIHDVIYTKNHGLGWMGCVDVRMYAEVP